MLKPSQIMSTMLSPHNNFKLDIQSQHSHDVERTLPASFILPAGSGKSEFDVYGEDDFQSWSKYAITQV